MLSGAVVRYLILSQAIGITKVLKFSREDDVLENKLSVVIGDAYVYNALMITDHDLRMLLQYITSKLYAILCCCIYQDDCML